MTIRESRCWRAGRITDVVSVSLEIGLGLDRDVYIFIVILNTSLYPLTPGLWMFLPFFLPCRIEASAFQFQASSFGARLAHTCRADGINILSAQVSISHYLADRVCSISPALSQQQQPEFVSLQWQSLGIDWDQPASCGFRIMESTSSGS